MINGYANAGRAEQLHAAGVASMSPYYEAALPSANSVASIIPALTAYATAAMPHLGSLPLPLNLPPASLAQATRQVSRPYPHSTSTLRVSCFEVWAYAAYPELPGSTHMLRGSALSQCCVLLQNYSDVCAPLMCSE